jgi:hypothetical protein
MDIQYLEVALDQFFLGQYQATVMNQVNIQLLLVHILFLLDLT